MTLIASYGTSNRELIEKLHQCGWLDEMPDAERIKLLRQLETDEYEQGYLNFAAFDFDTECIESFGDDGSEDINSYHKIIRLYAENSWGRFTPTNIRDEYDDERKQMHVGFDFADRRFDISVPLQSDWFDAALHDLINEALEKAGVAQRFLPLPVLDQILYLAFISPATFEKALAVGALPSIEQLLEEEGI